MKTISIPGMYRPEIPLDITCHDSNEEPENECTNTLISFKTGGVIRQYFNQSVEEAISKFENDVRSYSGVNSLEVVFCVVTKFKKEFYIDWPAIERHYQISNSKISA